MNEAVKFCGGCQTRKPLEAFAKHRHMPDGLQNRCKPCANAYGLQWRKTHPKPHVSERRAQL
jgi:hypothetical protein